MLKNYTCDKKMKRYLSACGIKVFVYIIQKYFIHLIYYFSNTVTFFCFFYYH